jgi:ABC-type Fe3+-hydroxamate transport system substrate-binding protein
MSVFRFVRGITSGAVLVLSVLGAACGREPAPDASLVRDDFGELPRRGPAPRRIVSLSPATTELLFALGAGNRLVGRTHWDLFPDSARAVADLGNGIRPNVEAILAARPDLVVLYASPDNRDAANALRAAGIDVLALRIDLIREFLRATRLLGAAIGEPERARAVVDSVTGTLERVRAATASLPKPSVFLHAWENPLLTIGAGSYLSELVEIAGARNVFVDLAGPSPQVTFEEVLRRNPDAVLAGWVKAAELRGTPRWRALRAVRDGRILIMDTLLVGRPGVRLGEAAMSLARLLHPDDIR